ncbi:hypothetical protein GW17_00038473 [Ensete ventricosum]|nr:hypothetical protein GW17_00038473 [Ensete ventricosum]
MVSQTMFQPRTEVDRRMAPRAHRVFTRDLILLRPPTPPPHLAQIAPSIMMGIPTSERPKDDENEDEPSGADEDGSHVMGLTETTPTHMGCHTARPKGAAHVAVVAPRSSGESIGGRTAAFHAAGLSRDPDESLPWDRTRGYQTPVTSGTAALRGAQGREMPPRVARSDALHLGILVGGWILIVLASFFKPIDDATRFTSRRP